MYTSLSRTVWKTFFSRSRFVMTICALLGALLSPAAKSEGWPVKQWDATFGGDGYEILHAAIETADSGYLLVGESDSDPGGDKTAPCKGYEDYWVVKLAADGRKQWDRTLGGSRRDRAQAVFQCQDGGYMVIGASSSSDGDRSQPCKGSWDYWIVKLSANGNKLWDRGYGGLAEDVLRCAVQTQDGGYLLVGSSSSGIGGDKSQASRGGADFWVVRVSSNGVRLWERRYGGNHDDLPYSAIQAEDGGFLLAGFSRSGVSGDKTEPNLGLEDFWVVKIDEVGNKEWDRTFGGQGNEVAYGVVQAPNQDFIVIGSASSMAEGDVTSWPSGLALRNAWLIRIDSHGNRLYDRIYGGNDQDDAVAILRSAEGGYLLLSNSWSDVGGNKSQPTRGYGDYWALKLDDALTPEWDFTAGGDFAEEAACVVQSRDGSYLFSGTSRSEATGDKSQPSRGWNDFWVVKVVPEPMRTYYVSPVGSNLAPFSTWATAANTLQAAADLAVAGSTILVGDGVYSTGGVEVEGGLINRVMVPDGVSLRSVNGPARTIIKGEHFDGSTATRCVFLGKNASIEGFTLTHGGTSELYVGGLGGDWQDGGGIWCDVGAKVSRCIIELCVAYGSGGGILGGEVSDCIIRSSRAGQGGGLSQSVATDCLIQENLAMGLSLGGGAEGSSLYSCLLSGNVAGSGGGVRSSALFSCLLVDNHALNVGGGAEMSYLSNCTVVRNHAEGSGGGFTTPFSTMGRLVNSIVWSNSAPVDPNWGGDTEMDFSCTTPLPGGTYNITQNPGFLSESLRLFQLSALSPCIDAGTNARVQGATDVAGNPRISGSAVNMGAYESAENGLTVLAPRGGERWYSYRGGPHTIQWSTGSEESISRVRIDLLSMGGYYTTIAESAVNSGTFDWTIPACLPGGDFYKIRVCDADDTTTSDESNWPFAIQIAPDRVLNETFLKGMPTDWFQDAVTGSSTWTVTGHGERYAAFVCSNPFGTDVSTLMTGIYDLSGCRTATLHFLHLQNGPWNESLSVWFRNSPSDTWTLLEEYTRDCDWQQRSIDLPTLGKDCQLAFTASADSFSNVALDDIAIFVVVDTPVCPLPAPALLSPSEAATGIVLTPVLTASAYTNTEGIPHANSRFQVDTSPLFLSPLVDTEDLFAPQTFLNVQQNALSPETTYYWRVRYRDSLSRWSVWSTSGSFTTMPKVISPVFAPVTGKYMGDTLLVSVSCSTTGSLLRYTLDGSDPDETSPVLLLTAPLSLSLPSTLKVQGWAAGMVPSDVVTGSYEARIPSIEGWRFLLISGE